MRLPVVALVLASLVGGPASLSAAPPTDASPAARVDELFKPWNAPNSPGCAVAVMKDGKIVFEHGYGMADVDHDAKITPATIFNVGSIAKQFTGAAILMLAQEGKLSLDDPIRKFIPELPDFGTPITLRQMLHHTSGLRDYEQLLHFEGWRLDSPDLLTDGDIMYIMSRQRELNFPPGSDFAYSNTNFMLLAQVISRVSKQSFADFTMTRLFQPLGMKHTHFRVDHGETIKNAAYPYEDHDGHFDLCIPNYDTSGATNLYSTVEDLARWDQNFYTARVGGAQVIVQLQEPGTLNDGTSVNYAPGMFVSAPGAPRWTQSGTAGDAGYKADIFRLIDRHFSVTTLCNLASIDPMQLDQQISEIYLGNKLSVVLSGKSGPVATPFVPDPKRLDACAGTYADKNEDLILKLEHRGDGLWAQSFTGPSAIGPAQLEPLGPNRFGGMMGLDFGSNQNPSELTASRLGLLGPPSIRYVRVPDYKPTDAELREFAGVYSSKELDVPSYLTVEGASLVLHAPKMGPIVLSPIAYGVFVGGDRRIRFVRDSQGRVSGLLMSGLWNRVQDLRFERSAPNS